MSMPIWWCIFFMETVVVRGAPKLGHVLFDPLSYEAAKFDELRPNISNNKTYTSTTEEKRILIPTSNTFVSTQDFDAKTKTPMELSTKPSGDNKTNNETSKLSDMFKIIEIALEDIKNPPKELLNLLRTRNDANPALETREPCAEYEYNGKICKYIKNRLLCGYNKNKGELKDGEFVNVGNGCRIHNDRIECGYQKGPFNNPRRPPAWDETHYEDETPTAEKTKKTKNRAKLRKLVLNKAKSSIIETFNVSKDMKNTKVDSTPDSISVVTETDAEAIEDALTESSTATIKTTELFVTTDSDTVTSTADTKSNAILEVTKTASTESRKTTTESVDPISPTISDIENPSPSVKVIRSIIRSNAESSENSKTTASKVKNKRWCVEIGDRIVCHYTKNH